MIIVGVLLAKIIVSPVHHRNIVTTDRHDTLTIYLNGLQMQDSNIRDVRRGTFVFCLAEVSCTGRDWFAIFYLIETNIAPVPACSRSSRSVQIRFDPADCLF